MLASAGMHKATLFKLGIVLLLSPLAMALLACGGAAPPADVADVPPDPAQPEQEPTDAEPAADTVEVAADGTKFDPPVQTSEIPEGAWMCEMDSVHFASLEQGNGECPVCGMTLKQKTAGEDHHKSDEAAAGHKQH